MQYFPIILTHHKCLLYWHRVSVYQKQLEMRTLFDNNIFYLSYATGSNNSNPPTENMQKEKRSKNYKWEFSFFKYFLSMYVLCKQKGYTAQYGSAKSIL